MKQIKNLNEISQDLTLIDFYATWCGPCRMLTPILEQVDFVDVVKVDVEKNLILVKGAVPGPKGGILTIKNSVKA